MRLSYSFTLPGAMLGTLLGAVSVQAAELSISLELPKLNVAEYHRPYVALWVEKADQSFAGNLAVWYDIKTKSNPEGAGTKWLKDMRQWWRKSGRDLQMPVDGVSGATRSAGEQKVVFASDKAPLNNLPAGDYQLVVEAARESGGRELVRLPFQWPPKAAAAGKAQGEREIGAVSIALKP